MKKKIAIIGTGWFGCHISYQILKLKKYDIKIFERYNDIFQGASSNNQNRLHLGFHYPRSKITRHQSKIGFKKFLKKYPSFCLKIKNNIYAVAKDTESKIDFETFLQIMRSENLNFRIINAKKFQISSVSGAIKTNEMVINEQSAKNFFFKKLKNYISFNTEVKKISRVGKKFKINNEYYDYVVNCTYFQKFIPKSYRINFEVTSSIIYDSKLDFPALTVMDGPYFTIYPYRKNQFNIYSVLHSRFGLNNDVTKCEKLLNKVKKDNSFLHKKRKLVEKDIKKYFPNFKKHFRFKKFLTCVRTINSTQNAERASWVYNEKGFINVFSGKIDHVVSASEKVIKFLK